MGLKLPDFRTEDSHRPPLICYVSGDMTDEELQQTLPDNPPDPADYDEQVVMALESVVSVRTRIPDDAMTADLLGTVSGHNTAGPRSCLRSAKWIRTGAGTWHA